MPLDPTRRAALRTRAEATLRGIASRPLEKRPFGTEIDRQAAQDVLDLLTALEQAEAERDRLAMDALSALSTAAGIGTPAEGYVKAPECLKGDIRRVVRERDWLRAALHLIAAEGQGQVAYGRTRREQEFGRRLVRIVDAVAPPEGREPEE